MVLGGDQTSLVYRGNLVPSSGLGVILPEKEANKASNFCVSCNISLGDHLSIYVCVCIEVGLPTQHFSSGRK